MKRVLILIVILLCMCLCLSSCGEDTGTNEEVIEGYSEKTVLRFSDPTGGRESEIQDLRADGNMVYCAVTNRRAAGTLCYSVSDGTVVTVSSVSWVAVKIANETAQDGLAVQAEDAELTDTRNQGFAFLPGGAFVAVGLDGGDRTVTVYEKNTAGAADVNALGIPAYRDCFVFGKAEANGASRFDVIPADDHTAVLIPVPDERADVGEPVLIDLNMGACSAPSVGTDLLLNGFCREGILYCCAEGELRAVDIRTGEDAGFFEPFRVAEAEEADGIRVVGAAGDDLYWTDTEGIHVFSLTERENRRIDLRSAAYAPEEGWTIRKACVDGNGNLYLQYEKNTDGNRESAVVCYAWEFARDVELKTLSVAGVMSNIDDSCSDEKGICLTKIITSSYQPEELWNEQHTYLTDFYQLHLYADFEDPVIRPNCSIEGCDHRSPSCEAWALRSEGYPVNLSLGDRVLRITQIRQDLGSAKGSDPRFPNGTGLVIERQADQAEETDYQVLIPDAYLIYSKWYYDGRYLIFLASRTNGDINPSTAAVYVLDTDTGSIVKEFRYKSPWSNSLYVTADNRLILLDYDLQKGLMVDTVTWQCSIIDDIGSDPTWYELTYDGSVYTARPLYDSESLSSLPNPYGLAHSQVFLVSEGKGLVRFSDGYRDEVAIVDLDTGEILSETVPMKNEWGEDIPHIYLESDKYYIFRLGAVRNATSYPAPPDYFDGINSGTYRWVYAFIEKEAFWNGSTDYTVFEMP